MAAELYAGERRRGKNANFGSPALSNAPAQLIWLLAYLTAEAHHRRGYRAEREEHPEWIDLGGES